jgi:hypothetical protein
VKPHRIDIVLEIPRTEVFDQIHSKQDSRRLSGLIIERHRDAAERAAEWAGGWLATDRQPEFHARLGANPFGQEFLLTSSRWWSEVPDDFDPARTSTT